VAAEPRPGETAEEARQRLLSAPGVRRAVLERGSVPLRTPNDPAFNLHDTSAPNDDTYQWNLRREHFRGAWNYTRGGGAKIAVVDTGADGGHPDLSPRIVAAVDKDPADNSPLVDENGHGTHVSGLACGNGDDNHGVLGGAYKCKLTVESVPSLFDSATAAAINDATDRGVKVINMSFGTEGGGSLPATAAAITRAWNRNVVMVAAACNTCGSAPQGDPAQSLQATGSGPNIYAGRGLVVTAVEYDRTRAEFSGAGPGRGPNVSMAAFGDSSVKSRGIFSSYPAGVFCLCKLTFQGENRYAYLLGTSMATPQVAAAAGLIRSLRPGLSAAKVIRLLKRHADPPPGHSGYTSAAGWGVLNAGQAVKAARRA
jgi:serine protease